MTAQLWLFDVRGAAAVFVLAASLSCHQGFMNTHSSSPDVVEGRKLLQAALFLVMLPILHVFGMPRVAPATAELFQTCKRCHRAATSVTSLQQLWQSVHLHVVTGRVLSVRI